jgi:capsular exopolysaccharide synthesis family protein
VTRGRSNGNGGSYGPERLFEFDEEPEKGLADYVRILFRRKWSIGAVFILGVLIAWGYTKTLTPVYVSSATVEVGPENQQGARTLGDLFMAGWMQSETYTTVIELLKSRSMAASVAEKVDESKLPVYSSGERKGIVSRLHGLLESLVGRPAGQALPPPDPGSRKEALVGKLLGGLSVARQGESRLLKFDFEASDPAEAQELLRTYIDVFIADSLNKRRKASAAVGAWLKAETERAEKKLKESMQALVAFSGEHGIVTMSDGSNQALRYFNTAAEGLLKSKEQTVTLETVLNASLASGIYSLPPEVRSLDVQRLQERVSALETQYSEKLETYTESAPKVVLLRKQIEQARENLRAAEKNSVTAALDAAKRQELLKQQIFDATRKDAMNVNEVGIQYAVLKKEVETNEQVFKLLKQKSNEQELSTQVIANNYAVVDPPTLPGGPVRPKKDKILLVGALIGLLGGIVIALVLEQVDDKLRGAEEIERSLALATLGTVPDVRRVRELASAADKNGRYEFLAHDLPKSLVSEAVKNIKTSLLLSLPAASSHTILVTSALPGEGKTFVAVSIATALSSKTKRVAVVDSDLRRPRMAEVFGEHSGPPGLTTLVTRSDVRLAKVIHRSRVPGLYYVCSGPPPPNPVGLLESDRMTQIINQLKEIFDVVVFDSPPILGFSDARILSSHVDGVILVARQGFVPIPALRDAKNLITLSRGSLTGVVINMASGPALSYGGHKYYSYYKYYKGYSSRQTQADRANA